MNTVETLLDMRELIVLAKRAVARFTYDNYENLPDTEKDYVDVILKDLDYAADNIGVLARLLDDKAE